MLLLTIDSSAGASVAVTDNDQTLATWETAETNTHAETLAPAVQDALCRANVTGAELDAVVVGVGPGPFTGLRVGLALGQSLAMAWGIPLHGICSLDAVALRAVDEGIDTGNANGEFLTVTDARRREVYWARFEYDDAGSRLVEGPFVAPAADLPDIPAVGAGVGLYPDVLHAADGIPDAQYWTPRAAELGELAEGALAGDLMGVLCEARPLYLRDSDAKVPAQMRGGAG